MTQPNPRKLTLPELSHLSCLIGQEEEMGTYYGNRDQHYARNRRLAKWVSEQIKELARAEDRRKKKQ